MDLGRERRYEEMGRKGEIGWEGEKEEEGVKNGGKEGEEAWRDEEIRREQGMRLGEGQ